jgi:hypothetical protein
MELVGSNLRRGDAGQPGRELAPGISDPIEAL